MSESKVISDSVSEAVKAFGNILEKSIKGIIEACELYVKTIDAHPEAKEAFRDAYDDIPSSAWRRFEAVGRGTLHPKLLMNMTYGARLLESCPLSEQSQYVEKPLPVLLSNGDSLMVNVNNLAPSQAKQVFARGHIRTVPEQKAYIEHLKTGVDVKRARTMRTAPYVVRGNKLIVGDVVFTKGELVRIIKQMK